ncbi:MAG TPA: hypothetical protein VGD60_09435 [Candidatus Acidoferrales bacterium]
MKQLSILFGTLLLAALSTSAQNNFSQVSFAAPAFGVTPAAAISSPSFALPAATPVRPGPFASLAPVAPLPTPEPEPAPQAVQGVFEKYSYDVAAGYTFFRFYEVPGITSNMNGFNGSFVYWYRDRIGPDAEIFATYGSQPGINSWLTFGGVGPRVRWIKPGGIDLWAHALFGGAYITPKIPYGGQGTVAGALGGGVDLNGHHRHMAIRLSVDGVATHFFGTFQFSPMASAGIVYKF